MSTPATFKNGISVGASLNDQLSFPNSYQSNAAYNEENVAFFSSRGPTRDGRVKPDILAPGFFVSSALGSNTSTAQFCDVQRMAGTSMATPIAAGMVVKVRQYFREGYYPTGAKVVSNAMTPSGALLKAVIVHSGTAMKNAVSASGLPSSLSYPSFDQGYGRIFLNSTLKFAAYSPGNQDLFVVGAARGSGVTAPKRYQAFSASGVTHAYKIHTSATTASPRKLRVTLCYTDYPGSPSSRNVMVNYLSLSVADSSVEYDSYEVTNSVPSNVFMVEISTPIANHNYTIMVKASWIAKGPQPYALVVTGDFDVASDQPQVLTFSPTLPPTRNDDGDDSVDDDSSSKSNGAGMAVLFGVIIGGVVIVIVIVVAVVVCCFVKPQTTINPQQNYAPTTTATAVPLAPSAPPMTYAATIQPPPPSHQPPPPSHYSGYSQVPSRGGQYGPSGSGQQQGYMEVELHRKDDVHF